MSYKYPSIFLLFLLLSYPLAATHIVGGELTLRYIERYEYNLTLNLYYDVRNSGFVVESQERQVLVYTFSKRDNRLVRSDTLVLTGQEEVSYRNPACASPSVQTRLLAYQKKIGLDPEKFNENEGYYVVWERCCRNNVISNIAFPGDVGMVFYLEFPATFKNGQPFVNSSPVFSAAQGDFLCQNLLNTFSFDATDPDGDSLVYHLVTPLAGFTWPGAPGGLTTQGGLPAPPVPAPFPLITWATLSDFAINAEQAIPHDLNDPEGQLRIDPQTGFMSVRPSLSGLYVFSIKCEEYRNGLKIGEVRRDFQVLVVDCPSNGSPSLGAQIGAVRDNGPRYRENDIIELSTDENRLCFSLWIQDPDPLERIRLMVGSANFSVPPGLFPSVVVVERGGDSSVVEVCWPKCLASEPDGKGGWKPFEFSLVASDDRCPASDPDTLKFKVVAIPQANEAPEVEVIGERTQTLIVGESLQFGVFGEDINDDQIEVIAIGRDFALEQAGMIFTPATGTGEVLTSFEWRTSCEYLQESNEPFVVDFIGTGSGQV
ncbi:MAG: hypothetical protein HC880_15590 [Bacteroidia bacterium]|nr:hypothetical protein [Bacteroidia bacterium]